MADFNSFAATDYSGTIERCVTDMAQRQRQSQKPIHQQYGNCWCKICQVPGNGRCQHVSFAAATNTRRREAEPLYNPKPVRLAPVRHAPPRLQTAVDKTTASQRKMAQLWSIIDNRRAEGGKSWDADMLEKAKSELPRRIRSPSRRTVPISSAPPAFNSSKHKLRPPNLQSPVHQRRKALLRCTVAYMPRLQTHQEAIADQVPWDGPLPLNV